MGDVVERGPSLLLIGKTVETESERVIEERESSVCENKAEIKEIKC